MLILCTGVNANNTERPREAGNVNRNKDASWKSAREYTPRDRYPKDKYKLGGNLETVTLWRATGDSGHQTRNEFAIKCGRQKRQCNFSFKSQEESA